MEIAMMPSEGGIVVPERHKIDILGTEGRALRAEQYLEYFKKRVIAGLGCSEVDFGYGDSSNRSTADTMSQNMKDGVKDFQKIMEYFVTEKMFDELLVESNFGDDVLNDENRVYLKFREIDLDVQVKVANAYADLLNKNMITWDEARREGMGLEPINIPSPEEANSGEDLTVKYPEWFRTHWKLFDEPKVMIQALKVPFSALAEPAARSSSTEINSADLANAASQASAAQAQEANAKEAAKAKHNPKPVKKKDGYIQSAYNQMMQDIVTHIETDRSNNYDWLGQIVRAEMQPAIDRLITEQVMAFRKGYNHIRPVTDLDMATIVGRARLYFNDRANFYINRLTNHVIAAFRRKLPVVDTVEDRVIVTRAIMESFQYRADFINDVELNKAEEMGRAHAFFDGGHTKLYSVSTKSDNRCDKCTGMHKQEITLQDLTLDDIPPYHAGCDCKLTTQQQVLQVEDEVNGQVTSKHASEIKAPLSHSKGPIPYDKGPLHRVPSGQAKYQVCTLRAKAKIRTMHPEWDDDKLTELAQQACMHHLEQDRDGGQPHDKEPEKKTGQKPVPRGAVGYGDKNSVEMQDAINMDSCLEKVKAKLRKSHPDWTSQQIAHHSWAICVSANNQEDKGSGEDN
jgi:hypothetical protein